MLGEDGGRAALGAGAPASVSSERVSRRLVLVPTLMGARKTVIEPFTSIWIATSSAERLRHGAQEKGTEQMQTLRPEVPCIKDIRVASLLAQQVLFHWYECVTEGSGVPVRAQLWICYALLAVLFPAPAWK